MFDTKDYATKMDNVIVHFEEDIKKLRTGRAHPSMLDGITVEAYGAHTPLNQVATITVPEPQLLQLNVFDPSNVKAVSEAIRADQGLGFNPSDDGRVVRVPVPALTEERRHVLVKQLSEKAEECRIGLRTVRQHALKEAKRHKDDKEISENELAVIEKDIDRLMSDSTVRVETISKQKEQEILKI